MEEKQKIEMELRERCIELALRNKPNNYSVGIGQRMPACFDVITEANKIYEWIKNEK